MSKSQTDADKAIFSDASAPIIEEKRSVVVQRQAMSLSFQSPIRPCSRSLAVALLHASKEAPKIPAIASVYHNEAHQD